MKEDKISKYFSTFILAGMTVCIILSCIRELNEGTGKQILLILSAFGALMGVTSTVFSANGSLWNFLFGIIDVSIYSYLLFDSTMPSQFLLHVLYILPMEFVGFFQWRKRGADSKRKVRPQRLRGKKWLPFSGLFAGVLLVTFSLSYFALSKTSESLNYSKMILDATITTANIVALVMMAFAYVEQWYLWMMVNITSIIIWLTTLSNQPDSGYAMVNAVKYIFYLLNAINGIRVWLKLSKGQ